MSDKLAFVLEPSRFDTSDAGRFGTVRYIFGDAHAKPAMWTHGFVRECLERMERDGYTPSEDYLVITGQATLMVLLVAHLLKTNNTVKTLLFDAASNEYVERELSVA